MKVRVRVRRRVLYTVQHLNHVALHEVRENEIEHGRVRVDVRGRGRRDVCRRAEGRQSSVRDVVADAGACLSCTVCELS